MSITLAKLPGKQYIICCSQIGCYVSTIFNTFQVVEGTNSCEISYLVMDALDAVHLLK